MSDDSFSNNIHEELEHSDHENNEFEANETLDDGGHVDDIEETEESEPLDSEEFYGAVEGEDTGNVQTESLDVEEEDSENIQTDSLDVDGEKKDERNTASKSTKLPMSRVKVIMKTDPAVKLVNKDALISTSKAAELFVEYLTSKAYKFTLQGKRKMVTLKDVESAILEEEKLSFLDGAMDF